jgi:hypothetical protein
MRHRIFATPLSMATWKVILTRLEHLHFCRASGSNFADMGMPSRGRTSPQMMQVDVTVTGGTTGNGGVQRDNGSSLVVRSLIAGGLSTPFRDASAGVMVLFAVVSIRWMAPHDGVQWRDVSM